MADNSINNGIVKYTSRDYESILEDFMSTIPKLTDLWDGEADSDPGIVLAKYLEYCEGWLNNHYLVYAHILPDNSVYVGMTGRSVQSRSGKQGKGYEQESPDFYNAIQSTGWDNIEHFTLVQNLSYEDALSCEEFFTKLFELAGFNVFNKKCGFRGCVVSEETKNKISIKNKGKIRTKEQRESASIRMKQYYRDHPELIEHLREVSSNQPRRPCSEETRHKLSVLFKGRKLSEEWRRNVSLGHIGKVPSNIKAVIATKPDGTKLEFKSCADCDRYFNKYSDWTSEHCRSNKITPEGVKLEFKEVV